MMTAWNYFDAVPKDVSRACEVASFLLGVFAENDDLFKKKDSSLSEHLLFHLHL